MPLYSILNKIRMTDIEATEDSKALGLSISSLIIYGNICTQLDQNRIEFSVQSISRSRRRLGYFSQERGQPRGLVRMLLANYRCGTEQFAL